MGQPAEELPGISVVDRVPPWPVRPGVQRGTRAADRLPVASVQRGIRQSSRRTAEGNVEGPAPGAGGGGEEVNTNASSRAVFGDGEHRARLRSGGVGGYFAGHEPPQPQ